MYDVFLSYNRAQKEWTGELARRLEKQGFNVWFDDWVLRGGEVSSIAMERGIVQSRHVILVVSPEFLAAEWPAYEIQIAILLDPSNRGRKLIPILHTKCDVPPRIQRLAWIDFSVSRDDPRQYEFRLKQLIADLAPDRFDRPRSPDYEEISLSPDNASHDSLPPAQPLPPGSRIFKRPNSLFVDRETEMRQLAASLKPRVRGLGGVHAAVSGTPGVGKTQLAIEYAHRYGNFYPAGVFWLNFGGGDDPITEIVACGEYEAKDQPDWGDLKPPQKAERVQRIWQDSEVPRLLIFDNAEDPIVVDKWRPKTGKCCVLITSRRTEWPLGMDVKPLIVETLPREKSLELLATVRESINTDSEEREAASRICQRLGDLPQALFVTAAYLHRYQSESASEYLEMLSAQLAILEPSLEEVSASFAVSLNRLDPENYTDALAQKLFHLASWFATASINRTLLATSAKLNYGEQKDRHKTDDAVARLHELGLVRIEPDGRLLLHRLLREFARTKVPPGTTLEEAAETVGESLRRFAREENHNLLPQKLTRERVHLREAASQVEHANPELAARLYKELGVNGRVLALFKDARADYERAHACFERALKIDEATHGPYHPEVAIDINNLGNTLRDLADLTQARAPLLVQARACFERALKIDEATYGPHHRNVAVRLNNLGFVLLDLGDPAGARACYERALEIDEATYGPDHDEVATDLNNLGNALGDLGELAHARACFERALKIGETVFGVHHPNVAIRVNNLGGMLQKLGDRAGAGICYERALKISEATYGSNHPEVANAVNNLGGVLQDSGDLDGARACYQRALTIGEVNYGLNHPQVGSYVNNLGSVLRDLGDLGGAHTCFERALKIDEVAYGQDHPTVASRLNNLGGLLRNLDDVEGARACFERALKIDEAGYGPNHQNVARDVHNLGGVLQSMGDIDGARNHFERALRILRQSFGYDHPETLAAQSDLAKLGKK